MTKTQEKLFQQMVQAIEEKNQKELEYLLAERNAERLTDMYRMFVGAQDCCIRCGGRIEDYEDVEQTDKEMIYTYKCPHCGFYGVQHHELVYTHTEEVK